MVNEETFQRKLSELIAEIVGWDGEFVFDPTMPDGTPRKLLDVSRLAALGWKAEIGFAEGMREFAGAGMRGA